MNLNFHQTFKPERNYLSELISTAEDIKNMSLEQISHLTGIPQGKSSGKLVPHLKYAELMGLIKYEVNNGEYSVVLTDLGNEIKREDFTLSETLTLLLMHHNIIKSGTDAVLWSYCFYEFFDQYGKKSKYSYYLEETERRFGKNKSTPFIKSYEELFQPLNILDIDVKDNAMVFNSFEKSAEFIPAIAYILLDVWDDVFPNDSEITGIQLVDLKFKNRFGWTNREELEMLEVLDNHGYIRLNKQLTPFTILKLSDKQVVLTKLYSELL